MYHYTDGRGLKGIIESQTIWFTDYRHLNDPGELSYGITKARDVIRERETGADASGRAFLQCLGDMLLPKKISWLQCFIASFSRDRDELGQEIVPYIAHDLAVRSPQTIFEIVTGPAAGTDAERTVRTMLSSLKVVDHEIRIEPSEIPYRAL